MFLVTSYNLQLVTKKSGAYLLKNFEVQDLHLTEPASRIPRVYDSGSSIQAKWILEIRPSSLTNWLEYSVSTIHWNTDASDELIKHPPDAVASPFGTTECVRMYLANCVTVTGCILSNWASHESYPRNDFFIIFVLLGSGCTIRMKFAGTTIRVDDASRTTSNHSGAHSASVGTQPLAPACSLPSTTCTLILSTHTVYTLVMRPPLKRRNGRDEKLRIRILKINNLEQ